MELKSLVVGNTQIENNIFLAPMAGYTDYAFRSLAVKLGYGLTFTELVSAKGLFFGGASNGELVKSDDYKKTVAQIFGADPYYMRKACESEWLKDYKIIDINMGCPVPKVYKNGEGSALLADLHKAEEVIKECVKSGKTITVKVRSGLKRGDDFCAEYAKMAEDSGASLITVHGRVRENYYSGEPNFNGIESAKKSVKIPVIANGGIFTVKDAEQMIDRTGADGIMIARGGIANPFLATELANKKPTLTLKEFIIKQIEKMREVYPNKKANVEFRKFVPYYFKGVPNFKEFKMSLMSAESTAELVKLIEKL